MQMAQGEAPAMGDFIRGGGGGGELEPWANAAAGAPPAYNPGTTLGGYNAIFDPQAPSSTGGWFTMDDYLGQAPSPMEASSGSGGMQSPVRPRGGGAGGNNFLSTNNWRLLGNDPDNFMINGNIVNRRQIRSDLAPKSVLGIEGGGHPGYYFQGGGQWMRPYGSHGSMQGNIGSDNWAITGTPHY
jgi:hypothetical protein